MATKAVDDELTLVDWLTRCEAIADSDAFVQSGHPEDQVILLKAELLRASAEGVNWREIYRWIYESTTSGGLRAHFFPTSARWRLRLTNIPRAGKERNGVLPYQEGLDRDD